MENFNDGDLIAQELIVREPIVVYGKKVFSIEEYLAYENASTEKHEYYNGEIFAMAGAAFPHNIIFKNLYGGLLSALKKSPCQPYGSDLRLNIPSETFFTYPDISIYCGDIYDLMPTTDSASLPIVIIEILSPSTKDYDRGAKFNFYQKIPSLKEYILVDSEKTAIDIFRKDLNNRWKLEIYREKASAICIESLNLTLTVNEIYASVRIKNKGELTKSI